MGCETCEDISCQMMEMKAVVEEMSVRFRRQEECIHKVFKMLEDFLPKTMQNHGVSSPQNQAPSSIFPNNNYLTDCQAERLQQFCSFPQVQNQSQNVILQQTTPKSESAQLYSSLNGSSHLMNGMKSRSRKQHAPKKAADVPLQSMAAEDHSGSGGGASPEGLRHKEGSTTSESEGDQQSNLSSAGTRGIEVKEENEAEVYNSSTSDDQDMNGAVVASGNRTPENGGVRTPHSGVGLLDSVAPAPPTSDAQMNDAPMPFMNGMPNIASNHQTLIRFLSDQQKFMHPAMSLLGAPSHAHAQPAPPDPLVQAMLQHFQPGPSFDRISSMNDSPLQLSNQILDKSGVSVPVFRLPIFWQFLDFLVTGSIGSRPLFSSFFIFPLRPLPSFWAGFAPALDHLYMCVSDIHTFMAQLKVSGLERLEH